MRSIRPLILTTFLGGILALGAQAQSVPIQPDPAPTSSPAAVPAGNSAQPAVAGQSTGGDLPDPQRGGGIQGTVTDANGNVVVGALVTLGAEKAQRILHTDSAGFFNFTGLGPGTFQVTVTSQGFTAWVGPKVVLSAGQHYEVPEIALQIAAANTNVRVVFSRHDLAEEQLKAEEKQRVLGVFPNFYTTYDWHAAPLSTGQKFQLAWMSSIDPVNFAVTGVIAGIEQWQNYFSGYGQGTEGYAKRFGASYADGFIGNMIGGAILPSILHQDPRYFYKGTGSIRSRALYAIATVVITKGDNGRWQPNYSNVFGTLAAAGISNLYYPPSNQTGAQVTIDNAMIGLAAGAATALLQEFLIKKISRGIPPTPNLRPSLSVQPSPSVLPSPTVPP